MAEEEKRYTFQEATEQLGGISKSTLLNWIGDAGLREAVDNQAFEDDLRVHYLTRAQLEQIAKAHRRTLKDAVVRQVPEADTPLAQIRAQAQLLRRNGGVSTPANAGDLSGIWHSRYHFTSTSREGEFESEHHMLLVQLGSSLTLKSIPGRDTSQLSIELTLDGPIATGKWQEQTSPTGYYKGAIYYGTMQLMLDEDHKHFSGKWLGFSKEGKIINEGTWELTYVGEALPFLKSVLG